MHTETPLFTDLYQLTMAYGYWKLNRHQEEAAFELSFRHHPFNGHFAIAAGLQSVIDFLAHWQFSESDLSYLATLTTRQQTRLFPDDFLDYLKNLRFNCHIDAAREGTLVFAQTPLLRIEGPLLQCQLLESPLLNMINFQTLIATKAAHICLAASGDEVIEFGLRRAQGPDGALSATRAAFIGGCSATSNTLAGKLYGIPVRGTHAHSWVTAFASEIDAFEAYASVMPHNGVFLVDTYHSLTGVENAITVGKQLRAKGADLLAIRLDSGDLAAISIAARKQLDEAGFTETKIMASNNLDEAAIRALKKQGAKINLWGVGTHLVTAFDRPALDGVYKMTALRAKSGEWQAKLKLSEQPIKISLPGRHQVRRYVEHHTPLYDVIYDLDLGIAETSAAYQDVLAPVFRAGKLVCAPTHLSHAQKQAADGLHAFLAKHGDHPYPITLEPRLAAQKAALVQKALAGT